MNRRIALTALLLVSWQLPRGLAAQVLAGDVLTGFRADATEIERLLIEEHCDVTRLIQPAEIRRAAADLRERMAGMERHEAVIGLSQLVALPEDGHSGLDLAPERAQYRVYPFWGSTFADGYFVLDAPPEHAQLVGRRLVAVGELGIDEVLRRLITVTSAENDFHDVRRARHMLRHPEVLHAVGVIDRVGPAVFHFEDGSASGAGSPGSRVEAGERSEANEGSEAGEESEADEGSEGSEGSKAGVLSVELEPWPHERYSAWAGGRERTLRRPAVELADGEAWGFELLDRPDGERTLYIWMGHLVDDTLSDAVLVFVRRLQRFVEQHDFDRTVLDLSGNGGGSANNAVALVRFFSGHPKIDRRGRFFTLTSPATYSAAALFCGMLQNRTRTLFVGEPSGQGINLFGDATSHVLPHTGLRVTISDRWWQCDVPEDDREWMTLDVPAPRTHADFVAGRPVALEAALAHEHVEPEPAPLTAEQAARYAGRYAFSSWQELVITAEGERLSFRLRDLCSGPAWLAEVASDLRPVEGRFLTDVQGVTMLAEHREAHASALGDPAPGRPQGSAPDGDADADGVDHADGEQPPVPVVRFDWRGVIKSCRRLGPGERLPLERADGGNIGERPSGPDFLFGPNDRPDEIERDEVAPALAEILADAESYRLNRLIEDRFNTAGYRFLFAGDTETARRFFEANVELFPRSWNVHDSLGEALAEDDELEAALASYRRSMELNPDSRSGPPAIRRIERMLSKRSR